MMPDNSLMPWRSAQLSASVTLTEKDVLNLCDLDPVSTIVCSMNECASTQFLGAA
jgi:hypothetical protein